MFRIVFLSILILFVIYAVFLFVLVSIASGAGCVNQQAVMAADDAAQSIRFGLPHQAQRIDHAIGLAHTVRAPAQFVRRILIARRYLQAGHKRLAVYHLYFAASHSCY